MPSIAMLVLTVGLMFAYSALHPMKQTTEAGSRLAKRLRLVLLSAIMILSVATGYLLPLEIGQGLARMSKNQAKQQVARFEQKMMAERQHTARMIELFGGNDRYLNYLNATKAKKTPF